MAQNYDLTNTGAEVQERLDQVPVTQQELATEVQNRIDGDAAVTTHCEQYTDAETQRAQGVENDLQAQIDAIVSKDTTVSLSVSPTAVFADGTDKEVVFVATSSPTKATVVFDGGEPQEGTRLEFPVTVNSATPTTVTKTAQFTVQGVSKGSKSATVSLVFPIYYGAGSSADVLDTEAMVAHAAIASPSFTQSITTEDNDYIFFEVPEGMADIHKVQLYDDPTFPTDLSIDTVETPREGYKAFKTVYARLAGTHIYKIS
jgi:hypothetical protein